jgi:hypothetical protein
VVLIHPANHVGIPIGGLPFERSGQQGSVEGPQSESIHPNAASGVVQRSCLCQGDGGGLGCAVERCAGGGS